MDVAGLVVGIVGLYTTCRDCYAFFTTAKNAESDAAAHLRELEIQRSILNAWGFHWQIQDEDGAEPQGSDHSGRKPKRLHEFLLRNRFKAEGVFKTLSALADTLSNQEKLTKRYGIQFKPAPQTIQDGLQATNNTQLAVLDTTIEDVQPVIGEIKNRLSVLNKLKWALKDKGNFKELIAKLRSHSDSLYRLCPENAFESMNIYFIMEFLAKQESPEGLKQASKIASQHAEVDQTSSVRDGYELLASAATLKASVNGNRGKEPVECERLATIEENQPEMRYLGKGLALFEGEVVYVEMRDYRGPPLPLTAEQKQRLKRIERRLKRIERRRRRHEKHGSSSDGSEDGESADEEPVEIVRPADPKLRTLIRNFFNTFHGANMMKSVFGLDIAGMIDHREGEYKGHCSILYKLPGTIGIQTRERPAENLKLRAPVTLKSLLGVEHRSGIRSTLGDRFELARNLVRALCLLHTSGWLHKNIRAESVIFFPEHVTMLQEDGYEVKFEINVAKPILMGYTLSRPDNVRITLNLPPVPQVSKHTGKKGSMQTQSFISSVWDDPVDLKRVSTSSGHGRKGEVFLRRRTSRGIYGYDGATSSSMPEQKRNTNISGFTLDYYQQPAKHADPMRAYRHAYDVYSLGVLLLEIGLWKELRNYEKLDEEDHYERRRWLCSQYLDQLRFTCGDTYADVVLSCIMIDSSDDEVVKASERELCARIVADLEGCRA
ncbi:prion-inhibition and propagation-domain-containing protein [Rhypophila decipiens]|uniref:Prion-inhibition and propagation-domain-containing protein n=1 Tax=Rhypophila decipiens TaxID=261697 RepID=A0AAN7B150_9PEZI|nr:prion-inhibition and propagation-domain-containing protein [Rhypophila decipiens]